MSGTAPLQSAAGKSQALSKATHAEALLQRKCACGSAAGLAGECEECKEKKLQGKLSIGASNDPLEREAERIADQVMAMSPNGGVSGAPPRTRGFTGQSVGDTGIAPTSVDCVLAGSGRPLDSTLQQDMAQRFRYDFSRVRVHTGVTAEFSASELNADAYTVGRDIVFGPGKFAPGTHEGRQLLGHELAHVVQQSGTTGLDFVSVPSMLLRDNPREESAANLAATIAPPGRMPASPTAVQARVQRQEARNTATETGSGRPYSQRLGRDCIQPVSGDELEALLQSRAVTVVDFWADWCGPCKMLADDLAELCQKYRVKQPAAPIRFFSVNVDDPTNKALTDHYYTDSLPQLLIYVGPTLEQRIQERPEFEITERTIETAIDHAARSGAARGAATGAKVGAIAGGIAGLAVGLGLAFAGVLTGGLGFLAVLGLGAGGALAGTGLGAAIGAFVGWLSDRRDIRGSARRGAFEADALIRRHFGSYLPRGTGPLHGAPVHPVTQAALRKLWECRHDGEQANPDIVGWTDTGPEPLNSIATRAGEPICENGEQLEHATPQRPVIYYAKDKPDSTVLIHEGLHAYEHPHFVAQVRNRVSEAATEYFTRQISSEIGAPPSSAYENWLPEIRALAGKVGESALRAAYFRGDFRPANRVLGKCGLEEWAQKRQQFSDLTAAAVLEGPARDYCHDVIHYPETSTPAHSESKAGTP